MVYIMALIYSLCILIYFFNFKSKVYYKILCVIMLLPVIFIDLIDMIRPGMYMDLVRMYEEMKSLNLYGWYGISKELYLEAILSKVYLYLVAVTGINSLLPIINTFLVYFLGLYIINKIGNKLLIGNKLINEAILFVTLFMSYFYITTNIRYPLAATICFVMFIFDLLLRKSKIICAIGYIFSILLHPAVIIAIFFRICANYSLKYFIIVASILFIIINFYLENVIQILLTFNIDTVTGIVFKINAYNEDDFQGFTNFFRLSVIVFDIISILIGLILKKYLKEKWHLFYKKIINFNIILSFIGLLAMLMDTLYANRMEAFIVYFFGIYFYIIHERKYFKLTEVGYNNLKIICYVLFFIASIYFWYFNIYSQYNFYI